MVRGLKIINYFYILLFFILINFNSVIANDTCNGFATLSVNGDNGSGDDCEFYFDLYRTHRAINRYGCKSVMVPKLSSLDRSSECSGFVDRYQKESKKLSEKSFYNSLEETITKGINGSVISLTDHGDKVPIDKCTSPNKCLSDPSRMESRISMGADQITTSELREKIFNIHEKQTSKYCNCTNCDCSSVPPIIFNFDHCYSGGMLNSLFDFDNERVLQNVCGLAAADEGEYSYTDDVNIAKALSELEYGAKGPFSRYYKKFDLDGDRSFSLSEVQNYMNKKTKKSTPLLTSQKFLLDYYDNMESNSNRNESLFTELISPMCKENFNFSTDKFKLFNLELNLEKSLLFEDLKGVFSSKNIYFTLKGLSDKNKKIQKVMDDYLRVDLDKNQILDNFKKEMDQNIFGEQINLDQKKSNLYEELIKNELSFCEKHLECKKQLKNKDLNTVHDLNFINNLIKNCNGVGPCKKIIELRSDISKIEKEENKLKKILTNNKNLKDKSKKDIKDKIKDVFKKFKDKFVKKEDDKKYNLDCTKILDETEKEINQGDLPTFNFSIHNMFIDYHETKKQNLTKMHQSMVKTRKQINKIKMFIAKKSILKNRDERALDNYHALDNCEKKPLIKF